MSKRNAIHFESKELILSHGHLATICIDNCVTDVVWLKQAAQQWACILMKVKTSRNSHFCEIHKPIYLYTLAVSPSLGGSRQHKPVHYNNSNSW